MSHVGHDVQPSVNTYTRRKALGLLAAAVTLSACKTTRPVKLDYTETQATTTTSATTIEPTTTVNQYEELRTKVGGYVDSLAYFINDLAKSNPSDQRTENKPDPENDTFIRTITKSVGDDGRINRYRARVVYEGTDPNANPAIATVKSVFVARDEVISPDSAEEYGTDFGIHFVNTGADWKVLYKPEGQPREEFITSPERAQAASIRLLLIDTFTEQYATAFDILSEIQQA